MKHIIDDVRIKEVKEIMPPSQLLRDFPVTTKAMETTFNARSAIHSILNGADDRLLVVVGPCSIHDLNSALEYAARLKNESSRFEAELVILMRVYFEKPRTTIGWKGLINDPQLDGSYNITEGLQIARRLLWEINELGLPCATEFLDTIIPQYTADLISWGAIGARTTESQVHRELASGLSCPVGFKNGTDGNIRIAIDAIKSAASPHHFLSVTKTGHSAIVSTKGNEDCHIILRGGKQTNFDAEAVNTACQELGRSGLSGHVMIDFSHGNSRKEFKRQIEVAQDIAKQLDGGEDRIIGVMIESHLNEGRQDQLPGVALQHGVSITDACLGWEDTVDILDVLAGAVRSRRLVLSNR
jgi:3-deoxy-7-phosphoheptulonate synthase